MVNRWKITSRTSPTDAPFYVVANTATDAWRKFVTQAFGAIKPNRTDWNVDPAPPEVRISGSFWMAPACPTIDDLAPHRVSTAGTRSRPKSPYRPPGDVSPR